MGRSKVTIDHEFIKKWAEERGAKPSLVKKTINTEEGPGMIRLNFPGYTGAKSLQDTTWEEFFKIFDQKDLALVYQDEIHGGRSNFNKIVSRKDAEAKFGVQIKRASKVPS